MSIVSGQNSITVNKLDKLSSIVVVIENGSLRYYFDFPLNHQNEYLIKIKCNIISLVMY
jgi:hypothetical protein